MDIKNQPSVKIPAVRTYARDLEANRKAKGLADESSVSLKEKETPITKAETKKKVIENIKSNSDSSSSNQKNEGAVSLPPLNTIHNKKKSPTKVIAINSRNSSFIVDDNNEIGATIITDTKKDRFRLIPAVIDSISKWFADKKTAFKARKTPKYTVPESTRRKGVIQRATGVTGKLTTSDFSSIHKRIKERKEKDERHKSGTTWSPNTEPVFLLLESPDVAPVTNVKVVARKSFRVPEEIVSIPPIAKTVETKTTPTNSIPYSEIIAKTIQEEKIIPEPEPIAYQPIIEESSEENFEIQQSEEFISTKSKFKLLLVNTNTLAMGVSGLVLALIVTIIYSYVIFTKDDAYIVENASTEIDLIIDSPIKLASGESNERRALLKVLDIVKSDLTDTTQIAFIFNGYNERPIPPQILMSIFGLSLERNFAQSVSTMRFGFTKDKNPFILMKTSNEIVAKGGLLQWETNMVGDLAELFSLEENELNGLKFIDGSISNTDVRIIKDDVGQEKIIHGLKNNTVIITIDTSDFTEIVNLIK